MARTRSKAKMDVKMLVEAEDRRKGNGRRQTLLVKRSGKRNQYKVGEEMNDYNIRMAKT